MPPDDAELRSRVADAIFEAASDAVIVSDRDGVICLWSAGAERMFGFAAAEALGQSLDIVISERLQARHWDGFHKMMASGQSRYPQGHLLSAPGRRKDGTQVSVEFTAIALKGADGRVSHIVAIMRDVTARFEEMKALRQQLAAREAGGSAKT
jgi:PAS domain S-box-containing protein